MPRHPYLIIAAVGAVGALTLLYRPLFSDTGYFSSTPEEAVIVRETRPAQSDEQAPAPIAAPETPAPVPAAKPDDSTAPLPKRVEHRIPFIPQAPGGKWDDPLFKDACEESSSLMAMLFAKNEKAPSDIGAALHAAGAYEEKAFGHFVDTSAVDTLQTLKEYFGVQSATILEAPTVLRLKRALADGKVIVAPTNGRLLGNPNFRASGPEYHMLVVIGYDEDRGVFITHDPGTRLGAYYTYPTDVLLGAIADYPTGRHEKAKTREPRVIIVGRNSV